jgi:Fe/S biogenesis protein NfuA
MGIMDRFRGTKNGSENEEAGNGAGPADVQEGIPLGIKRDAPILTITSGAKEKIRTVLATQTPPVRTIRVSVPARGRYAMSLEPDEKPGQDDAVLPYDGFQVFVDPQSLGLLDGAMLEWIDTHGGGGFQFSNPNDSAVPGRPTKKEAPEGPEGDVWRQIQQILDDEINPAVAGHGGYIDLIEVRGGTVYVQMGGGCQGCGMANVTLKAGVERLLKDQLPEVEEVLDVTDHAGGRNPYYAPTTK